MATVLQREGKVDRWNDDRLDELSGRMDAGFKEMREGFARVDREMKEGFAKVDQDMKEGFARIDKRFETFDRRFETFEDRFFKLMVALLVIGAGLISTLIAAQV